MLETPAIAALHSWRPDLRISVLVEPRFAEVLEGNSAISELILSRSLGETALDLLRRKFPIVFNQHGGPRSAMLTGASGSPSRVGWAGYQYSFRLQCCGTGRARSSLACPPSTPSSIASRSFISRACRVARFRVHRFLRNWMRSRQSRASWRRRESLPVNLMLYCSPARVCRDALARREICGTRGWLREKHGIASVVNLGARDEEIAAEVQSEMRELCRRSEFAARYSRAHRADLRLAHFRGK